MEEFSEGDILGRILPRLPQTEVALPRTFKPWHKPRKQWIRRYQWLNEVLSALNDTHFPADARVFRYLSMPGEDLLDICVLREACDKVGVELRFTGLNSVTPGSANDLRLNVAESEVRGLRHIHPGSQILRERFEAIANPDSLASKAVRDGGPFNAINVDLCDYIALKSQISGGHTIIDALAKIVDAQLQHSMHPWLLFITTRVAPDRVDRRNLAAFIRAVSDNIMGSKIFEAQTAALLHAEGERLREVLATPDVLEPERFTKLFCLGFGKWLLTYISAAVPTRQLRMLKSCFYAVQTGRPDMLSLAFRCDPVIALPTDRYELIKNSVPQGKNEVELGIALTEATASLFDLDAMLTQDAQLLESVTIETEQLLKLAHYPVKGENGYRAWLQTQAA
jgi:hypothetical protein